MVQSTFLVALVLLVVIIQSISVESFLWPRRRADKCSYPKPTQGNLGKSSDYFYGHMSLWSARMGKRATNISTLKFRHSVLLFRGTIFEWGIRRTYYMRRPRNSCKIKWRWTKTGESKCLLKDAKRWTKAYRRQYGRYRLFFNNGHHFVNRFSKYLDTNCGR